MHRTGATVIWRCHIGVDVPNALVQSAWAFLLRYLEAADAYVFTRAAYVGEGLDGDKVAIIPPSIDVFSRQESASVGRGCRPEFWRRPASCKAPGRAARSCEPMERGASSRARPISRVVRRSPKGHRIVTQISRWDRLKDPMGVMRGFLRVRDPSFQRALGRRRPCGHRGRRRSRRRGGAGPGADALGHVRPRPAIPHPPRVSPDGRRGRECGDRQRAPEARIDRGPEEPRRRLWSDRRRSDVEGPRHRRWPRGRHSGSDSSTA